MDLEALEGVRRVVVEAGTVWVICEASALREPVDLAVRRVLLTHNVETERVPIEIAHAGASGERRRVRFERVERFAQEGGLVRLKVTLEWHDRLYTGEAVGEAGLMVEQRTAGAAALDAVQAVIGRQAPLRLVGVKQIRAFDEDLLVASVYRSGTSPAHFVGAVRAGVDPLRGAAVAVLNALNRMLGNYLATAD